MVCMTDIGSRSGRSVPARSRVILAWCFSTMTAATAAAASVTRVGSCHAAVPTSATVAASEPSETMRVLHTTAMNTTMAAAAAMGASTTKAPLAVATPLPPRKRSHTGATWPTTEATAASATAAVAGMRPPRQPDGNRALRRIGQRHEHANRRSRHA